MYTVLKFGGTSVTNFPEQISNIINDVYKKESKIIVVFSALSSITDLLYKIYINNNLLDCLYVFKEIKLIHRTFIHNLDYLYNKQYIYRDLEMLYCKLYNLITSNFKNKSMRYHNTIITYGEKLSVLIYAHILHQNGLVNKIVWSEFLITTDTNIVEAFPDLNECRSNVNNILKNNTCNIIITTGYVGRDIHGRKTTLGRNGSDFTATILASVLNSNDIYIYSDVDGILTADPRKVRGAKLIKRLNFRQVSELCYFGSCVLHPKTLIPLSNPKTKLYLKNVLDPSSSGTTVNKDYISHNQFDAITSINNSGLITLKANGLIGVSNITYRVFKVLSDNNIDTSFITQSSCDHNLSFNIDLHSIDKIYNILSDIFSNELLNKSIESINIFRNISIITIIGYNMIECAGVAGKIFSLLGSNNINIIAIAQGTSEIAISFIVQSENEVKVLKLLHHKLILL